MTPHFGLDYRRTYSPKGALIVLVIAITLVRIAWITKDRRPSADRKGEIPAHTEARTGNR
jgi:hypothetical protein